MDCAISFSPLAESDIPSILEIESDSQPEPWTRGSFLEEINRANSSVLIAKIVTDGSVGAPVRNIAGYICFWWVEGEIQILNIAVSSKYRRKGIARKLMELAISKGREKRAAFISLEVRESNLAARMLYETLGFRITGRRPNYYGVVTESGVKKESAILMELDLKTY